MKKLIISLLAGLTMMCAHSDTVATSKNKAGGYIVLTDVVTERCKGFVGAAYTTGSKNDVVWGCWFTDDLMVHVLWSDGDTRAYSLEGFVVNEEVAKRLRDRKKGGGQTL